MEAVIAEGHDSMSVPRVASQAELEEDENSQRRALEAMLAAGHDSMSGGTSQTEEDASQRRAMEEVLKTGHDSMAVAEEDNTEKPPEVQCLESSIAVAADRVTAEENKLNEQQVTESQEVDMLAILAKGHESLSMSQFEAQQLLGKTTTISTDQIDAVHTFIKERGEKIINDKSGEDIQKFLREIREGSLLSLIHI